jgi:hypothetical protein
VVFRGSPADVMSEDGRRKLMKEQRSVELARMNKEKAQD